MTPFSKTVCAAIPSHPKRTDVILLVTPEGSLLQEDEQFQLKDALISVALQSLNAAGGNWQEPDAIDGAWYASSLCAHLAQRAKKLVADIPTSWDSLTLDHPAIVRMLPFWLRQFDDADLPTHIIFPAIELADANVPFKHPSAWLRTLLDAERLSRGRSRLILPFNKNADTKQSLLFEAGQEPNLDIWARNQVPVVLSHLQQCVETDDKAQDRNTLPRIDLKLRALCLSPEEDAHSNGSESDHALLIARLDKLEWQVRQDNVNLSRLADTIMSLQASMSEQFAATATAYREHVAALEARLAAEVLLTKPTVMSTLPTPTGPQMVNDIHAPDNPGQPQPPIMPTKEKAVPDDIVSKESLRIDANLISEPQEPLDPTTEMIRNAALFDADYYLAHNPDVQDSGIDPAEHYHLHGGLEGRDPGPSFWSSAYLAAYPDVAEAGVNPLIHYMLFGANEGRDPRPLPKDEAMIVAAMRDSPLFDADAYVRQIGPDALSDPARHYYDNQRSGTLDPSPNFWAAAYLTAYPDVAAAGANPLAHYLLFGASEGRDPRPLPNEEAAIVRKIQDHPLFDAVWYCEQQGTNAQQSPARHFYDNCANSAIDPGPGFKSAWYLRNNSDVHASTIPAFLHFINYGEKEERLPAPRTPEFARFLSASPQRWAILRLQGDSRIDPIQQGNCAPIDASVLSSSIDPILLHQFLTLSGGIASGRNFRSNADGNISAIASDFPPIVDAWFIDQSTMRLRLGINDSNNPNALNMVSAYQVEGQHVKPCGAFILLAQGPGMLTVRLHNPLFPIMLVLDDGTNNSARARLIPFPSLYRGGMHASEAAATANDDGFDINGLSGHLLAEVLDKGRGAFAISKIIVDGRQALQTEPIYDIWIRQWLGQVMRIPVEVTRGSNDKITQLVESRDALFPRDVDGYTLNLPNNHLPTIASLIWRTSTQRAAASVGDFISADRNTCSAVATIKLPAGMMVNKNMLDFGHIADFWPSLEIHSAVQTGESVAHPATYLSISFRSEAYDNASLLLRSAPDLSEPILPRTTQPVGNIHVIIRHVGSGAELENCLLSLSQQTKIDALLVTVLCSNHHVLQEHLNLARTLFGSRIAFLATDKKIDIFSLDDDGDQAFLFLDDCVILHDHRIIETLETLADHASVASASCLLVGYVENGKDICVISSGNFYDPISNRICTSNMFSTLPYANYPVACSNSSLTFVPSHARLFLAGFQEQTSIECAWEYFMAKSHAEGLIHLATSMVSAIAKMDVALMAPALSHLHTASIEALPQARVFRK